MYFWRIERLKVELRRAPFTDRQVLPYLVASGIVTTAAVSLPGYDFNLWDYAGLMWSAVLAAVGIIYAFHCNGGSSGEQFVQRFFSIGWVVTVRWLVGVAVAFAVYLGVLAAQDKLTENTTWHFFLFFALAEVGLYWRLAHHISDVSKRLRPNISLQADRER